ncbi:hypothetical protein PQ459_10310 [Chryseobacterium sp. KACC 21268]|nr:hypothetical protein PQ459_10310 [Chryseobacterium sp. KACC 21268]
MEGISIDEKRYDTDRTFKITESYTGWIKLVTTSLSAFLGVLFAVDVQTSGIGNNTMLFGCMCISIVVSIIFGFLALGTEPFLLGVLGQKYYSKDFDIELERIVKILLIISGMWLLSLLVTFIMMILIIANKFIL